ncbi:hypothetical protein BC835DRAFT_1306084 [Cytidiella melzeri]|nr:hypothetical protein BC835DRAFT_1306084 [Cytidiella melzeri]
MAERSGEAHVENAVLANMADQAVNGGLEMNCIVPVSLCEIPSRQPAAIHAIQPIQLRLYCSLEFTKSTLTIVRLHAAFPTLSMPKSSLSIHRCGFCGKRLPTAAGVRLHIQNSSVCRRRWELQVTTTQARPQSPSASLQPPDDFTHLSAFLDNGTPDYSMMPEVRVPQAIHDESASTKTSEVDFEHHLQRFVELYPGPVADILGEGTTTFERWDRENKEQHQNQWYPFGSKDEWEIAAWLAQNVGHNKIDEFPKLEMVIDQEVRAHRYEQWICDNVTVVGNILGENGKALSEELELWRRNPVECVRKLIGNPAFREAMSYTPERVFSDEEGKSRVIDEMWTADWWWRVQVSHCIYYTF